MAPLNKALFFKQVPSELPKLGQDIAVEDASIDFDAELPSGAILVKVSTLKHGVPMSAWLTAARRTSTSPSTRTCEEDCATPPKSHMHLPSSSTSLWTLE